MDHLCYFCLVLLCFHARFFVDALWSPAGKGLTSWLSFVMSNCDVVTFPLVFLVSCCAWLYRFLIFALFLTFIYNSVLDISFTIFQWLNLQRATTKKKKKISKVLPGNLLFFHYQLTKFEAARLTLSLPSTSKNQYLSAKHVSRTPEY